MRHLVLISALSCAAASLAAQDDPVTGQYMEDRSNRVYGCPCEWSSEFVNEGLEAILAWNIQAGEFQGANLAGLRLVAVLVSNVNLGAPGSLRRSTVFIDEAASVSQRRAGEGWLRSRYGDVLGRVLRVHAAPMEFSFAADSVSVTVRGILSVQMRRARLTDDTQSWASLLYEPFTKLVSSSLGTTLHSEYRGPDLRLRWVREGNGITGYYGSFTKP